MPSVRSSVGCALFAALLALPASAHGGAYRGPGGVGVPGGGFLPSGPAGVTGPVIGPTSPGSSPMSGGSTLPDLYDWGLWWRQNQALYLQLKEHVRSTGPGSGSEGWFLGDGQKRQKSSLGPTEQEIRSDIVPALLTVLEKESSNDLLTGAMIALAKIGLGADTGEAARIETARIETALTHQLTAGNQEVRETAAIALGILASPRSIPTLAHLLWDTSIGQKTVKAHEVGYRTRAFAAYGLGLTGARTTNEPDRQLIVSVLRRALESDDTSSRDLEVACLVSIGLVPLATIETPAVQAGDRRTPPETSRLAELDYVLALFRDEKRAFLTRAQCPVTLARLLMGSPQSGSLGVPEPQRSSYRAEIARELLERIERGREQDEILQSCVLALGELGTNDDQDALDNRIRRTLAQIALKVSDLQTRAFALLATADAGARFAPGQSAQGLGAARANLADELTNGKNLLQPWAALATGVLGWNLARQDASNPELDPLRRVLRVALLDERSVERVGAYALGAGLGGSQECAARLMTLLEKELPDGVRGQVGLALALLQRTEATELLREIVAKSKYQPETLRQCAMALAILGDKEIGLSLAGMLKEARSLASQSAIASALGFVGDRRAIEPLLALVGDRLATDSSRAFAAVALGNVADKELLPWNAKIGYGLNYRAAPATLSDPASGTGILDLY